ncbi:MAG TPA: alpha/beta fold hydrolase [Aquabacterium sp.]|uniref:PHA/PHB synthase family protein n=1 Tax=Aquabacterium sp. TaxID=1872578 RepID=UPI002E3484E4|nr:alpha/beta fold hydrolase [Aquabacterium sp.]HEX5371965.1 alpha/beta fold hydrolase [Aquabacterium sp.]
MRPSQQPRYVATSPVDAARALDQSFRGTVAHLTSGLSPIGLGLAWADWAWHLAAAPGTAARLVTEAQATGLKALARQAATNQGEPPSADPRFSGPEWSQWPYSCWAHLHDVSQAWWDDATNLEGVEPHHRDVVRLFAHQWMDFLSPSNWPWTNPQVIKATVETKGSNLVQGLHNALDDWRRVHGLDPLNGDARQVHQPGVDVACTPGQVVHRNHLVELLQYEPTTPTVKREPVFIVPSWIMKYYILDLSPHNSMVRYLVSQGHTVFILSWRNPDESDALIDMEDYLHLGVFDCLAAITRLTGGVPIHAAGYCLGGTLLSIGAAALARPQKIESAEQIAPIKTLTLLAAEVDFREPGDLGILIDESQVKLLEDMMAERGFLTGPQMAGSFQFLHSRDLIYSTRMREYLLGERDAPSDLMDWNADVTRMPVAMHSQYLHSLYLNNTLADGRYRVEGQPVSLSDIRVPMFAVGTVKDHVSPWKSVYKIHRLTETELTFVLTSGGHNAGIVSEPGHPRRDFQLLRTPADAPWLDPDAWAQRAERVEGSWWPTWHDWLSARSEGEVPARQLSPKTTLGPAPGTYVHVRYRD